MTFVLLEELFTEVFLAGCYRTIEVRNRFGWRIGRFLVRLHKQTMQLNPVHGPFWDAVWNLNCEQALSRLSGSPLVLGEKYSFRENGSGTKNIYVNGKSTSCWIDTEGRIGSLDQGGPTVYQWLNWFHKNPAKVIQSIKEVFPECLN